MSYHVATFYKFTELHDAASLQQDLKMRCTEHHIKGTILLATEGLNATIAGERHDVERILAFLQADGRFDDMNIKWSEYDSRPFQRMKVRLKNEIVTMGLGSLDSTADVGQYVPPTGWNELLDDPDITVIDTRNGFEVEMGTFDSAINPNTKSFREFTAFVQEELSPDRNPNVALFCTGGIRCEKATSYMLDQGFKSVYHLEGGILNYLTTVDESESRWNGECFVFDDRISVIHGAKPGSIQTCKKCSNPLSVDNSKARDFEAGLCCDSCLDSNET